MSAAFSTIRLGRERARIGRWRGDSGVALLTPLPDAPIPSSTFLGHCTATLAARGYQRVVTGALSPAEQQGFLDAGFDVEQRLHLLVVDLGRPLPGMPEGAPIRRVSRWHRREVLNIDTQAFPPFWQFDSHGLADALRATPSVWFRGAVGPDESLVGYAICGLAGSRGYVQRLAVLPGSQRSGTGRRLLLDGLDWMKRRGVRRAVVNTQVGNQAALRLYVQVGFEEEPGGLSVLSASLQ